VSSTDEVAAVMRFAAVNGIAIVPQGGNTGLVGGSVPLGRGDEIVLSLRRMNRIRRIDGASESLIVEAGATLMSVQDAAIEQERSFPLSLASEGTATIGGAIATNAGGTAALAYGTMRDLVLGLEVVLPDGRKLDGLSNLRKDNTGYDLKSLFVGSEGTLGIVTAASLRLFPLPRSRATAICGLKTPEAALDLFHALRASAGFSLTTFELMPRFAIELATRHMAGIRDPLEGAHDWYVMVEWSGFEEDAARAVAESGLGSAISDGIVSDAVLASSLAQREAFWALREALPEAQTREGASIKHDISVPIARIPAFIARVLAEVAVLVPGIRPFVFGHVGDGNLHFNLQSPVNSSGDLFMARAEEIHALVYRHVIDFGGSISAEHGIGQVKRAALAATKDPVAFEMMRRIKSAFDPEGRMNPGKLF
jgi:FAD/FMN-containing dehydrogenase